jgi:hypothetical protein
MFVAHSIANYSELFAAAAASCIGFATLWSNPKRRINRVFFTASLHVSVWLICRAIANADKNLFLYRVTTAVGALTVFHLWLVRETVAISKERFIDKLYRGRWWLAAAVALGIVCFTEWYIPTPDAGKIDPEHRYGFGFYTFVIGLLALFSGLCIETVRQIRTQTGVQRLELQLLLFGGSATAITVLVLMAIRIVLSPAWIPQLVPYVVLLFYAATVVAITRSRVFDARQLFFVGLHKLCLVFAISFSIYCLQTALERIFSIPVAILLTVAIALWLTGW